MAETLEGGRIEGVNLPQFFLEITQKVQMCQKCLLDLEAEHEHTETFGRIFDLLDGVLKEVSRIEEAGLVTLSNEILFRLNEKADNAIREFEEVYGNKETKTTTRPN